MPGIHWFRRDLRLTGNPALLENLKKNNGEVLGIFFFDSKFLKRQDFSHNRFGFFLKTLKVLKEEMAKHGGELLVLDCLPVEGFEKILDAFPEKGTPLTCSFNRDYEPFAQTRDEAVSRLLKKYNVQILTTPDHILIEPHEVKKPGGGTYQIFTPFYRTWYKQYASDEIQKRIQNSTKKPQSFTIRWKDVFGKKLLFKDQLESFIHENKKHLTVKLPEAGHKTAYKELLNFKKKLSTYSHDRDYPSKHCTSKLSIYLKNGSLTTAQIFFTLKDCSGSLPFLRQLVWREFYYYILFHHPYVEHAAFHKEYQNLEWQNDPKWFLAWKHGQTGYPIIDAGMRELATTGFMHNRVRMIVASFLTKDLLIDWRWGEEWFMKNLLDGDLAANNGGWQWAASTGCDPQPYFRIFNPILQSNKFDPNGDYIRTYVPELRNLNNHDIHFPSKDVRPKNYPAPIVIHSEQKIRALSLFRKAKKHKT